MSVKDSSYSSQCVDSTEWLHTSITCDIWMYERDLFFMTKTLSLEAVVKEESMNYPSGTTGPCHEPRREERERKGREKGSTALLIVVGLRDWKDARRMCLPALVILHTAASPSVQLIGIQSRAGSMREWWWWGGRGGGGGSCCLSPATLNLHCSLGIDWGTSKRDRHTVTGKMNCHLAFLNLLAASNWPLWTMWRDTDWVLVFPSWAPKEEASLISSVQALHAKYPCRGASVSGQRASLPTCIFTPNLSWGTLFFLTTPHYFIVLLRYSAFQLVLFFLRHIVMAVWQAHGGGKLLGVAIWILEAIPGSIKTLTLAKSLVSLSYYADGVGKGCSRRGTQEAGASGRLALPDPIEPDSDGGWLSRISQLGLKRPSVP